MAAISKSELEHLLHEEMQLPRNRTEYFIIRADQEGNSNEVLYTEVLVILHTFGNRNNFYSIREMMACLQDIGWRYITYYRNPKDDLIFGISTFKDNPGNMIESPADDYYKLRPVKK